MHGFVLAIVPAGGTPEVQASLTEILPKANSLLLPRSFASPPVFEVCAPRPRPPDAHLGFGTARFSRSGFL